jgi:hypothetical protein
MQLSRFFAAATLAVCANLTLAQVPAKPVGKTPSKVTTKANGGINAKTERLILKEGAPLLVKTWFETFPEIAANIRARHRAALVSQVEEAENELKSIKDRKIGKVYSSNGFSRSATTDMDALRQKDADYKAQKAVVAEAKKEVTDYDKLTGSPEVVVWKSGKGMGVIREITVGTWGVLNSGMKVSQVVNENELIVKIGDKKVWLSGFDTSSIVDDQGIVYDKPIIISKTKKYTTVLGGSVTCYYAEPFPAADYVEIVSE